MNTRLGTGATETVLVFRALLFIASGCKRGCMCFEHLQPVCFNYYDMYTALHFVTDGPHFILEVHQHSKTMNSQLGGEVMSLYQVWRFMCLLCSATSLQ